MNGLCHLAGLLLQMLQNDILKTVGALLKAFERQAYDQIGALCLRLDSYGRPVKPCGKSACGVLVWISFYKINKTRSALIGRKPSAIAQWKQNIFRAFIPEKK